MFSTYIPSNLRTISSTRPTIPSNPSVTRQPKWLPQISPCLYAKEDVTSSGINHIPRKKTRVFKWRTCLMFSRENAESLLHFMKILPGDPFARSVGGKFIACGFICEALRCGEGVFMTEELKIDD